MIDAEDVMIASHFVPSLKRQLLLKKAPANEIGRLAERQRDRQTKRLDGWENLKLKKKRAFSQPRPLYC